MAINDGEVMNKVGKEENSSIFMMDQLSSLINPNVHKGAKQIMGQNVQKAPKEVVEDLDANPLASAFIMYMADDTKDPETSLLQDLVKMPCRVVTDIRIAINK